MKHGAMRRVADILHRLIKDACCRIELHPGRLPINMVLKCQVLLRLPK